MGYLEIVSKFPNILCFLDIFAVDFNSVFISKFAVLFYKSNEVLDFTWFSGELITFCLDYRLKKTRDWTLWGINWRLMQNIHFFLK